MAKDVVFLLGAGAVKDAGLPTAVELTDKVTELVASSYPSLMPALRYVQGGVQFRRGCHGHAPLHDINIEELVTGLTLLSQRADQEIYPFVAGWHERVALLESIPADLSGIPNRDAFDLLVSLCRERLPEWLAVPDPSRIKYLWSFKKFVPEFKLRIFTLNYDDCIEQALSDQLGSVNGAWTSGFSEKGWMPELLDQADKSAYLYKLHGSLDWYSDAKLGICSTKWPQADESEGIPSDAPPLLIFGTTAKLRPVDPFLSLLFHFQQALNRCSVIVVVGYGFGDTHVNEMLAAALQRDSIKRCVVTTQSDLSDMIRQDSDLWRAVDVEKRFVTVRAKAQEAFDRDKLLRAVQDVLKEQEEAAPF